MKDESIWPEERPKTTGQPGGCLRGCFVLGIVAVVAGVVVVATISYFVVRFVSDRTSQDPVRVQGWLDEVVAAKIPAKYEPKMGMRIGPLSLIYIAPMDKRLGEDGNEPFTQFIIRSLPGVDFETLQEQFEEQRRHRIGRRNQENLVEETVNLTVGQTKQRGTKREWEDEGEAWTEFDVLLKRGVLFVAVGPTVDFDREAMDELLASVVGDDTGDSVGTVDDALHQTEDTANEPNGKVPNHPSTETGPSGRDTTP